MKLIKISVAQHTELKTRATKEGKTLAEFVRLLIDKALEEGKNDR